MENSSPIEAFKSFLDKNRKEFLRQVKNISNTFFKETGQNLEEFKRILKEHSISNIDDVLKILYNLSSACYCYWSKIRIRINLQSLISLIDSSEYYWIPLYFLSKRAYGHIEEIHFQKIEEKCENSFTIEWCQSQESEPMHIRDLETFRNLFLNISYLLHSNKIDLILNKVDILIHDFIEFINENRDTTFVDLDITIFFAFLDDACKKFKNLLADNLDYDWLFAYATSRERLEHYIFIAFEATQIYQRPLSFSHLYDKILSFELNVSEEMLYKFTKTSENVRSLVEKSNNLYVQNISDQSNTAIMIMALKFLKYYIVSVDARAGLDIAKDIINFENYLILKGNIKILEPSIEKVSSAIIHYQLTSDFKDWGFLYSYFNTIFPNNYNNSMRNIYLFLLFIFSEPKNREEKINLAQRYIANCIIHIYPSLSKVQCRDMTDLFEVCFETVPSIYSDMRLITEKIRKQDIIRTIANYPRYLFPIIDNYDPDNNSLHQSLQWIETLLGSYKKFLKKPNLQKFDKLEARLTPFFNEILEDFDFKNIDYQSSENLEVMLKVWIGIFHENGLINIKKRITENNQPQLNSWVNYQKNLIEEFLNSFAYNSLFKISVNSITKKFLVSQFRRFFDCTLNPIANINYIDLANQIAIKMEMIQPTPLPEDQLNELYELANSDVVLETFGNLKLDNVGIYLDQRHQDRFFFANLPDNISGVTIFGGTILIHMKWKDQDNPIANCGLKIAFLHELAHAIRKESSTGIYDISQTTPKSIREYSKGTPGAPGNDKYNQEMGEGGVLLEMELFSMFLKSLSSKQVDYLNNIGNWYRVDINQFKAKLGSLHSEDEELFNFSRSGGNSLNLDRKMHDF